MADPRTRLTDWVRGMLSQPPPPAPLGAEEQSVARWLRGDRARLDSLLALLNRRLVERARLPVSSTPNEAVQREAANVELHAICVWLQTLYASPLESAGTEQVNG